MEVCKGEMYFWENLKELNSHVQDIILVNKLVLEWVESALIDRSLFSLMSSFFPFCEVVLDVVWLLFNTTENEEDIKKLSEFLIQFISSSGKSKDEMAHLRKLAIERIDPELLEQAGIITLASALIKKTSRINTVLNYKYQKNFFFEESTEVLVRKELAQSVDENDSGKFFAAVGRWQLDLLRALDFVLEEKGKSGIIFLLNTCEWPKEKFKEYFSLRLVCLWRFSQEMNITESTVKQREETVASLQNTLQWGLDCVDLGILPDFSSLENLTWPKTREESEAELDDWVKNIKAGLVVGENAPFYHSLLEYNNLIISRIRNQRAFLYPLLLKEQNQMFSGEKDRLLEEEPYLIYLHPQNYLHAGEDSSADDLMRAISLNEAMPWLHDLLWEQIKLLPFSERFALYDCWEEKAATDPILLYSQRISLLSIKRFLRRLSKDNIRQYCRLLGKISHPNPVIVLQTLIEQVMVYDNLSSALIESLRYLTVLEFDILTHVLIKVLKQTWKSRSGLNEVGSITVAPWLTNLASFTSSLFKQYGNGLGELGGFLGNLYELLGSKEDGFLLVVFLEELLEGMGGVGSSKDLSDQVLIVKAVSTSCPQLKKSLLPLEQEEISSELNRSSKRLLSALGPNNLLLPFYIKLDEIRQTLLSGGDGEEDWFQPKVIGEFADRISWVLLQYCEFIKMHESRLSDEFWQLLRESISDGEEKLIYSKHLLNLFRKNLSKHNNEGKSVWEFEYSDLSLDWLYQEQIAKMSQSSLPNDKLCMRLLEEELKQHQPIYTVNLEIGIPLRDLVKRALISVPDAYLMGMFVRDIDQVEKLINKLLPVLTAFEAHNLGRMVNSFLRKNRPESIGQEQKMAERIEMMQIDNSSPIKNKDENMLPNPEISEIEGGEEGEMILSPSDKLALKSIFSILRNSIKEENNIDITDSEEGAEMEYIKQRNFLLLLWHLKEYFESLSMVYEDDIFDLLLVVEEIKSDESKEDLKVLASRVVTIFPKKLETPFSSTSIKDREKEMENTINYKLDEADISSTSKRKSSTSSQTDRKRKRTTYNESSEILSKEKEKKNENYRSDSSHKRYEDSNNTADYNYYYGNGSTSSSKRYDREYHSRSSNSGSYYSSSASSNHHRNSSSRWR